MREAQSTEFYATAFTQENVAPVFAPVFNCVTTKHSHKDDVHQNYEPLLYFQPVSVHTRGHLAPVLEAHVIRLFVPVLKRTTAKHAHKDDVNQNFRPLLYHTADRYAQTRTLCTMTGIPCHTVV